VSETDKTNVYLSMFLLGILFLGVALFQCYALTMMIEDNLEHTSAVLRAAATGATLPVPPTERFLGAGILGTYFPAVGSLCGRSSDCLLVRWPDPEINLWNTKTPHPVFGRGWVFRI